jgi:hypothetical protein
MKNLIITKKSVNVEDAIFLGSFMFDYAKVVSTIVLIGTVLINIVK